MTLSGLAALAGGELFAVMSLAWIAQRMTGNSGWVDVAWSLATGLAGVTLSLTPLDGGVTGTRAWVVAALVAAWSLRLGGHIALRAAAGIEDPRYAALQKEWGAQFPARLYGFLLLQALVAFGLAAGIGLAARNPAGFGPLEGLAILVLAAASAGEAAADATLRRFKANQANRGRICAAGLWAWSRHPNYFFEWLVWVAYPLFALSGAWPWGWLAFAAPALMYWTLRHASGVPPLETHMQARYGTAWTEYAARVPVFFPRIPLA